MTMMMTMTTTTTTIVIKLLLDIIRHKCHVIPHHFYKLEQIYMLQF